MRILFYLPVITPWWFDAIVTPLIAKLAADHEVHVLAPAPWRGTGIGPREQAACAHLPPLFWHLVTDDGHPTMRTDPVERDGIISFVHSLAPDYVLCRSADCETIRAFPGVVRQIMEGGADPLGLPADWVVFQDRPFDHGLLPALDDDQAAELDRLIAPVWGSLSRSARANPDEREAFRRWADLPEDRPILFLPLEYEHEENFFLMHRVGAIPNATLVEELSQRIGDEFFLAVTNHPLNERHVDNSALEAMIASHGARMRLFPHETVQGSSTTLHLMREAGGVLLGDSKLYALAGFLGTPMVRETRFDTGDWLNAYHSLEAFLGAVADKSAAGPDTSRARTWFAYHIANNVLDPDDPELTGADLLQRLDRPLDPARWEQGFNRFANMALQAAG